MPEIRLTPIKESTEDFDELETLLLKFFKEEIYFPLLIDLKLPKTNKDILLNSLENLVSAIRAGTITFSKGSFSGKFSAKITNELRSIGAKWDQKSGTFKLLAKNLPPDIRMAVSLSEMKMKMVFEKLSRTLSGFVPEKIAGRFDSTKIFDRTLFKTDRRFQESVKKLTIPPQLTPERRGRIAEEYTENMRLYIKDFTEKEIVKLRKSVQESAFKGLRQDELVKQIQSSFDVTRNKAKFLARQETALLMTKFKQDRYEDAGVHEYIWKCVAGSKNHPVRPWHKALENKKFRWDNPPITTKPGEAVKRNNPGQDYNCRCYAVPVVKF